MPIIENAVIAAAGLGSRLGLSKPKCLVEIGGKTLIEHQLDLLAPCCRNVWIVVGYQESQIMEVVRKKYDNVIFARNPAYQTTTTFQSFSLVTRNLSGRVLILDADLYFDPKSFQNFVSFASQQEDPVLGLTSTKTKDAVHAHVQRSEQDDKIKEILRFSRTDFAEQEWCNVAMVDATWFEGGAKGFLYEKFESQLPVRGFLMDVWEIDTPEDLAILRKSRN